MSRTLFPALVALLLATVGVTRAATLTVTNANDSGPGSLRAAVAAAQAGDVVAFTYSPLITLTSGPIAITQPITINGANAAVSGNNASLVFEISAGTPQQPVVLNALVIEHGNNGNGGGIYVDSSDAVVMNNCTVTACSASQDGGGIYNAGTATLTDCTLSSNTAGYYGNGGGIENVGAGLYGSPAAALRMTGCSVRSNTAGHYGGGLNNDPAAGVGLQNGSVTLISCVFYANDAPGGGGGFSDGATAAVTGCTFADNGTPGNYAPDSGEGIVVGQYGVLTLVNDILYQDRNHASLASEVGIQPDGTASAAYCDIKGNTSPFPIPAPQDLGHNFDADPEWVDSNAGDLHLQSNSPCVGKGITVAGITYDSNNVPRFATPSLGALEYTAGTVVVTDNTDNSSGSLRHAIAVANSTPYTVIEFTPNYGMTLNIALTSGPLVVTQQTVLQGPTAGVVVSGGNASRVLEVSGGGLAAINMTFTDGNALEADGGTGGGVLLDTNTSGFLTGCTLSSNNALYGGGLFNSGTATLVGCILNGNQATLLGGGCFSESMTALVNCVLAGNSALYGGGLCLEGSTDTLTGCSLTANTAPSGGPGLFADGSGSPVALTDDVLYGDQGGEVGVGTGSVSASFCDIQGGYSGSSNINADPFFVRGASAPFDLHVQPGSPCFDAGTEDGMDDLLTDISGTPRANPPTIGAYEGQAAATQAVLTSSLNPALPNQSVTFTATVANTSGGSAVPKGTVTFTDGGNVSASHVALSGGKATYTTTSLSPGSHTIVATFVPSGPDFLGTASNSITQTILYVTSTTLASSQNPSVPGQSVTFTTTVSDPSGTTPTGSVSFYLDGGTAPVATTPLNASAQAAYSNASLAVGAHTIKASYNPDPGYTASTGSLSQQINAGPDTTSSAFGATPNPAMLGQSVTLTVTITDTTSGSTGVPAGTVNFYLGSSTTAFASAALTPTGAHQAVAQVQYSFSAVGPNTVRELYVPTVDFTSPGSSTVTVTVTTIGTATTVQSSLNPSVAGHSVTFTAAVSPSNTSGGTLTGNVSFTIDGAATPAATIPLDATGHAAYTTASLGGGVHGVRASYTGQGNYASSGSTFLDQFVNPAAVTGVSVGWGTQTAPLTAGAELPWLGIKTLTVTLNSPAGLAPGDVTLTGKNVASYGPVTVSAAGSVYTMTLATPINAADRLTLSIGNGSVSSYSASFNVLPGDVNADGAVNATDMVLVKNAIGGAYKQADDIDGSGVVDINDYNAVRQRIGTKLP